MKRAAVTGGGGGIGAAIVRALAALGYAVAVLDRDQCAATTTAEKVPGATAHQVDLTVAADVARVFAEIGPVDVLVNGAGIDRTGPFLQTDEGHWQQVLDVNLVSTIRCSRAVLDGMLERGAGRIVCISSDAGKVGSSGSVVYSAAKGAVISFAKALAREVANRGVTVNCVCPGPTETPLLRATIEENPKLGAALVRAIPARRVGQPEEIAAAVAFLVGPGAGYITGQAWSVSGGLTMS